MRIPRIVLVTALAAAAATALACSVGAQAKPVAITVYKSPTCGCCAKWVEHLQAAGFRAEVHDEPQMDAVKTKVGVPAELRSCHTALVEGYAVEGHVPADVIRKLIEERPKVAGIAVPGMPVGSPGMESGDQKTPYDVVAFTKDGATSVYAKR
jgi:hypothetical protein